MNKAFALAMGALLVAGAATASNTGFKLNKDIEFNAGLSNANWVSVPFFYFPDGDVGNTAQNAIDMCFDANNGVLGANDIVEQIVDFDAATDTPATQACNDTFFPAFNLTEAKGYIYFAGSSTTQTIAIVGSHDDSWSVDKGGTAQFALEYNPALSNLNLVSTPYHTQHENAIDMCFWANNQVVGANDRVNQIVDFDTGSDTALTQACNDTFFPAFDTAPGKAYGYYPSSAGHSLDFRVY